MSNASVTMDPRKAMWIMRLRSALRTTLACIIVGCTTFYSPESLRRLFQYQAFSYVTAILIVSDATLGEALKGCWYVFCAIVQMMVLAIPSLWVIGPARFTYSIAAFAVAVCAFLIALPECTHLTTKRIAFGQVVIVYVGTVIQGAETGIVMHPVHVACSTALGALASVLAMMFPYPRLACYQVTKACRLYAENSSERVKHMIQAISTPDSSSALDHICQAKSISALGARHLQTIKENLGGILWEKPHLRLLKHNSCTDPLEKLHDVELPMRGMDIALSHCTSYPVNANEVELRQVILKLREQIYLKLEQAKCYAPLDAATAPETKKEPFSKNFLSTTGNDLPASFFMFCMKLLIDDAPIPRNAICKSEKTEIASAAKFSIGWMWESMQMRSNNLIFAFKCSLSLFLAVLFGLMYNKENGYWSGLTIAISFVTGRQATFKASNVRAQGTAMGSVYGALCCFIFQKIGDFRFLALLPWIIFSCFLMHSKLYGQAGGISAAIGALLILGRQHYGPPTHFAITRITEATIGLLCFIAVEILLNPSRAASLAKSELSQCLSAIQICIEGIVIGSAQKNVPSPKSLALIEKQKQVKSHITLLEKFTSEAHSEPNFWFIPFKDAHYSNILESLSRISDLLLFSAYAVEYLSQISLKLQGTWQDLQDHVNEDLELCKIKARSTLKCIEVVTSIESIGKLEKDIRNMATNWDVELGKCPEMDFSKMLSGNEEIDKITSSFLQHCEEMADKIHVEKDEATLKREVAFHYSCLAFCLSGLMKETVRVQNEVKQLLIWESPLSQPNLYHIYCKINAFRSEYTQNHNFLLTLN